MEQNSDLKVYEFEPNKKYILTFDRRLTKEDVEKIKAEINEWFESANPVLVISGRAILVQVQSEEDWEAYLEEVFQAGLLGEGEGEPIGLLNPADFLKQRRSRGGKEDD